jgi:hypothetical protein
VTSFRDLVDLDQFANGHEQGPLQGNATNKSRWFGYLGQITHCFFSIRDPGYTPRRATSISVRVLSSDCIITMDPKPSRHAIRLH